jgi:Fe-S oxidoreductase
MKLKKKLTKYYQDEKERTKEKCQECGICAKECPIIKHTELKDVTPQAIQKAIKAYLQTGEANKTVFDRAFSCMGCFKCVDKCCPNGLSPMLVNELIKWEYSQDKIVEPTYQDPQDEQSWQRVIASMQVSHDEYQRIFFTTETGDTNFVFFPGCNVYFQPEKILNALDIMNLVGEDFAFVAGLDFCCGNTHLLYGSIDKAEKTSEHLVQKLSSYHPETVIFWCPTCLCRFHTTFPHTLDLPFKTMSFPQFLARYIESLPFKKSIQKTATLHEACKVAFTGLDLNGPRELLQKIPGITLIEMPRHAENTVCCGSGAEDYFPKSFEAVRDDRLIEASQTHADLLVDVCHYCHNLFVSQESKYQFSVTNYVNLVAEALGITREDKFKKYKQCREMSEILEDAKKFIQSSPFPRRTIADLVESIFCR